MASKNLIRRDSNLSFFYRRSYHVLSKGCGLFGATGLGPKLEDSDEFHSVEVSHIPGNVVKIFAGWGHSALLTSEGKLAVFGRPYDFLSLMRMNRFRMTSATFSRIMGRFYLYFNNNVDIFTYPALISDLEPMADVRCSAGLTLALSRSGNIYSFGNNRWGQCGFINDRVQHIYQPVKIEFGDRIFTSIDTGLQHCIALSSEGQVFCWGKGNRGQIGDDEGLSISMPKKVDFDGRLEKISRVSAGFNHTAAVSTEGVLYVWGKGMSLKPTDKGGGFLNIFEDQMKPRRVPIPGGRRAREICSSNFSIVIRAEDDTLWAMGLGEYDRNSITVPVPVRQLSEQEDNNLEGHDANIAVANNDESAIATTHGTMVKGQRRVVLITADKEDEALPQTNQVLDVILHNGEAFLRKNENFDARNQVISQNVLDYSEGWLHSLLLVK